MALRGRRPKPCRLRLVDGTHRTARHGDAARAREAAQGAQALFGKPERPSWLKGQARVAWDRYIAPAGWLDASREPAAIAFCELWSEFRLRPSMFPAAKHSQLRGYMAELGLADERNRPAMPARADEFFKDD